MRNVPTKLLSFYDKHNAHAHCNHTEKIKFITNLRIQTHFSTFSSEFKYKSFCEHTTHFTQHSTLKKHGGMAEHVTAVVECVLFLYFALPYDRFASQTSFTFFGFWFRDSLLCVLCVVLHVELFIDHFPIRMRNACATTSYLNVGTPLSRTSMSRVWGEKKEKRRAETTHAHGRNSRHEKTSETNCCTCD